MSQLVVYLRTSFPLDLFRAGKGGRIPFSFRARPPVPRKIDYPIYNPPQIFSRTQFRPPASPGFVEMRCSPCFHHLLSPIGVPTLPSPEVFRQGFFSRQVFRPVLPLLPELLGEFWIFLYRRLPSCFAVGRIPPSWLSPPKLKVVAWPLLFHSFSDTSYALTIRFL